MRVLTTAHGHRHGELLVGKGMTERRRLAEKSNSSKRFSADQFE